MNYKKLLEKYMDHVYESEGTDFVSMIFEGAVFTKDEVVTLEVLSEVNDDKANR